MAWQKCWARRTESHLQGVDAAGSSDHRFVLVACKRWSQYSQNPICFCGVYVVSPFRLAWRVKNLFDIGELDRSRLCERSQQFIDQAPHFIVMREVMSDNSDGQAGPNAAIPAQPECSNRRAHDYAWELCFARLPLDDVEMCVSAWHRQSREIAVSRDKAVVRAFHDLIQWTRKLVVGWDKDEKKAGPKERSEALAILHEMFAYLVGTAPFRKLGVRPR